MEHASHVPSNPSPEHSIAELLRARLLHVKLYLPSVSSQAELRELEDVMRQAIETLERANLDDGGKPAFRRAVIKFGRP
jgi:hypothetical protein